MPVEPPARPVKIHVSALTAWTDAFRRRTAPRSSCRGRVARDFRHEAELDAGKVGSPKWPSSMRMPAQVWQ